MSIHQEKSLINYIDSNMEPEATDEVKNLMLSELDKLKTILNSAQILNRQMPATQNDQSR
jgi:hypothetical protein